MTDLARRDFLAASAAWAVSGRARAADAPEYQSVAQLADLLQARKLSSLELTDHLIARIERLDASLNAVVVRDFDRARDAARAADAAIARGDARPLLGVPITVKESFNVAGLPTTWGIAEAKGFKAAEDALVVARARAAGAVVLGKTNVSVVLADWQSDNPIYGVTRNPWDLRRTPGGSSGGSSAALAAGFGPLSLGSDIGGSLRVPAHFAGVASLKPTFGLVPGRGHTPPGARPLPREGDLAVVGPMARTIGDVARLLDVIAGPDELTEGVGYSLGLRPARHRRLESYRVLLLDSHPLVPTSAVVRTALDRLAGRLERAGVSVARAHERLPDLAEIARVYMRLLMAVTGGNWPAERYDRLRGIAATLPADDRSLAAERVRGIALSHRDWMAADSARARQQAQWRSLFGPIDLVLCPVTPTTAFVHDPSMPPEARRLDIDGASVSYVDAHLVWAAPATSAGLPAAVLPIDRGASALPIGVQVIGPYLEDRTVLAFAALVEREFGGFVAPPPWA